MANEIHNIIQSYYLFHFTELAPGTYQVNYVFRERKEDKQNGMELLEKKCSLKV